MKNLDIEKRELLLNRLRKAAVPVVKPVLLAPISRTDRTRSLPVSFSQQRLWFIDQLEGGGAAYHIPGGVRLHGVLDRGALQAALDAMLERHEALRTVFASVDGTPVQLIAEDARFALQLLDLSGQPQEEREAQVARQATEETQRRFDLSVGPLIRGRLIRLGVDEHVLLVTMHHIVSDGWSMGIFIKEVAQLYAAYRDGRSNPLAPLPIQYADYAVWQREWLHGEVLEKQLSYWKQQLGGAPELVELPTDRPRPVAQSHRGGRVSFVLSAELSDRLKRFSRQHDATLFMTLYTGFALLLSRLSGQEDVVIGTPVANRQRTEVEGLIGCFVNTLSLRARLSDGLSVAALLQQVKAMTLGAYSHQELPFEQVVEALQPARSLRHSPVFQVMLALQNTPREELELPELRLSPLAISTETAQFDLTLSLNEAGERLAGSLTYASDLFDQATIERWGAYFEHVLEGMVQDAEQKISAISFLSDRERELLIRGFNATEVSYPKHKLIHELFEEQVQRTPDAIAVVYEGQQLTYRELNQKSNQLAHYLRAHGVGPDGLVAICVDRSVEMVIGLLGILKSGGAYVPLDPSYPRERLEYMLKDTAASVVLTQARLKSELPLTSAALITLDQEWSEIATLPTRTLSASELGLQSAHLAYVIYTSGSTGQPKGVMVEHGNVVNFLSSMQRQVGIAGRDRLLAVTTLSFDIAGLEIYLPLISGAQLVLVRREVAADAQQLSREIDAVGATIMQATPASWRLLLNGGWSGRSTLKALCGGEALPVDLAGQIEPRVAGLWNLYGPTETTIWSCSRQVVGASGRAHAVESIGRPIANTQIYILDRHGRPVPLGVAGEIYIGGAGVARGYLNRPELTAERFVRDPFSSDVTARMYKTGDLGRWQADGTIEYLGRNDHQVKIRGFRIELGEIEAHLNRHPSVKEAVAVAREDVPGEKRLVSYIVPRSLEERGTQAQEALSFSLFYFGADTYAADNKYELYLKSAKFADEHGFEAIWTPERHFDAVGSLYPNPSILSAALATITRKIKLRAGSVVLPLHDPVRTAEEWAVVDNLSQGRTGVALATGWHPRDFVLAPQNFSSRKDVVREGISTLRALWAGGSIVRKDGNGKDVPIQIFPKPIQPSLPMWLTAAGNPETFIEAGRQGLHVLTHLLGQTLEELSERIALYRQALREQGHDPERGRVTVMVHTFLGTDLQRTIDQARQPFMRYMRAHLGLLKALVQSLGVSTDNVSTTDMENITAFAFERYVRTASLIGTPKESLPIVKRLREIGVDEIGCLIDWMDSEAALAGLEALQQLRDLSRAMPATARELKAYCGGALPEHMVPSVFVTLDALPLTPNGKLDRKALPAPQLDAYVVKAYEAPEGEVEEALAALWQELLQVERVGRHDNFFELGGHSLLAVQLMNRIQQVLSRELVLRELFEWPTLQALAKRLSAASRLIIKPIDRADRNQPVLLSWAQQRLWIIDQLEGGIAAYHVPGGARLQGALDREALQSALNTMLQRHETLRTVFAVVDSSPVQLVSEHARFALQFIDLSDRAREERETEVARQATEEAQDRFDLSVGPLIRGRLLRLDAQEHVLLVTMHHIVSDGWSMGIFIKEVAQLYAAFRDGRSNPLPPLPIQYADYAVWQRDWLQGEVLAKQIGYWKQQLGGAPALLELPTDRPRPVVQSYRGHSVSFALSAELSDRLKQLSRQHDVTLFMTLYAGLAILLSRLSGQDDVVIGTPVANRQRTEVEGLIGFFVNTLALRVQLNEDLSVAALLQRVKSITLEAYSYQELPLEQVVEALQPVRSLSHSPLFQVMLVLQIAQQGGVEVPGLSVLPQAVSSETAQYDLTLSIEDVGERIIWSVNYASDLFEQETIERWLAYLQAVLTGMARDAEQRIYSIGLLGHSEREQLIRGFNATKVAYPKHKLIHELFEEQVERTPDAIAVVYEGQQLTYRELNQKANQLAHYLRARGVGPDRLVAICLERSVEMVIGLLGILKAGGAYVPLDPTYPRERLEYMLKDAAASVVLTQAPLKPNLPLTSAAMITLDEEWSEVAKQPNRNLRASELGLNSSHLAYVIYTSGSTGQPKGAMNEHGAVVNRLYWMQDAYGLNEHDRVLQKTPFSFDVSVWEFFWTLSNGARLVLARPQGHQDPSYLSEVIQSSGITTVHFVPSMLQVFLANGAAEQCGSLRHVVCSGEALSVELQNRCLECLPQAGLHNLYGPTEAAIDVTSWECRPEPGISRVPIGRPISNTQIYILDRHHQPVPLGVAGEIYIGGVGVARGYLNRPELTAERFIPDPFSADPTAHIYKSGDLGRFRPDGTIEYLGRNDHQVKIRGFRIELGEIEAQLRQHERVEEAVVIAREEVPGEKRLVAYVTHGMAAAPAIDELRVHLKASLPEYMIPSAYVPLSSLPLTPNGKLDRKALPAPELGSYAVKAYEAPQGEIETALAMIWQELLHIERVGRQDSFFELGGHSLLIVQMLERLRRLGLQVEVRSVFTSPTLSVLASSVTREVSVAFRAPPNLIPENCETITPSMLPLVDLTQEEIERIVSAVSGGAKNVQDIYPLAPLQEGLLFHHVLNEGGGDVYVMPSLLVTDSRAQMNKLLDSIQAVIDRHDIWRTAVLWKELSRPVQVVQRRARLPIENMELDSGRSAIGQLKERMAPGRLRIDLQSAPLIRVAIAQEVGGEQWYALLYFHHMISDHVALEIVLSEVDAHLAGRGVALPEPAPYREYVAQSLARAKTHDGSAFFRSKLIDIDEPTAPFGLLNVLGDGGDIQETRQSVASDVSHRIRRVARHLNVSAATLFHAAHALVVAHTSGRDDVVFGTVLLGRLSGTTDVQKMLGMFINTLPLRLSLEGIDVHELVERTQRELAELVEYEHASLAEAQRCSGIEDHAPLFSAVLNYRHSTPPGAVQETGSEIRLLQSSEWTNYPWTLSVDDFGEGFGITAQVDRRIGADRVIEYLNTAIDALVQALERMERTPARALSIIPKGEREQLIRDFNATAVAYPKHRVIHELFEEQVERTPDAIAVVYEAQQLTYRQLNQKSNQLAHYLRARGVGPDRLVAICLDRSVEMVIGLLGILKAGGAYVPLDPTYPRERLEYMLKDAAASVVLTQARLKSELPESAATVIALDAQWPEIAQQPEHTLRASDLGLKSSHLAYVIYTSGSTGQPKGAMNEHGAVVNRLYWMQDAYGLNERDRVLQKTPFSFDVSVWEFFWTLSNGARLVLARPQGHQDPSYLSEVIQSNGITTVHFVPSMLQVFLANGAAEQCGSLRHVVCSGEALSVELQNRCLACLPQAGLHNLYGPTEAAIDVTFWECRPEPAVSRVPIGRPISNTQIYLLDRDHQPVPLGVAGEIYIGGAGVARGYLNRPELTSARFVRDPFSSDVTARMYQTGDLGRFRPDGTIEYLGRNDHQVKIRGFRIELGEIEAQLRQHQHVEEAVVIAREDLPGEKRLVAYVAHGTADAPAIDELRTHLKASLPEYMIPSAYVSLASLPLTPNGKLDRKALPVPELEAYAVKTYEAPQGELETALASIWQELLHVERVGRHDNFFELGGHSLLAVRLMNAIQQKFSSAPSLRELMETPTVAQLARSLSHEGEGAATLVQLTPDAANQHEPFPLTQVQLAYWIGRKDVAALGNVGAHVYAELPVRGLDLPRFEAACNGLIRRHGQLRMVITPEGEQRVLESVPEYRIALNDLRGLSRESAQEAIMQVRTELSHQVFSGETWPLFDIRASRLTEDEWIIHRSTDALVLDASSSDILADELMQLYVEPTRELPTLELSFRDYVLALKHFEGTPLYERAKSYWLERVANFPEPPDLPLAIDPGQIEQPKFERRSHFVPGAIWQRLVTRAQQHQVTPTVLFLSCFAEVLQRWCQQPRFALNLTLFNRIALHPQVDAIVGDFTTLTLLEMDYRTAMTWSERLRATQRQLWSDLEHRYFDGLSMLQALRQASGAPVSFPVVVTSVLGLARDASEDETSINGSTEDENDSDHLPYSISQTSQVWLDVQVSERGAGLHYNWDSVEGLFPEGMLDAMFATLAQLLDRLAGDAASWSAPIAIEPPRSHIDVVTVANATAQPFEGGLLHTPLLEQIARQGSKVAVRSADTALSYRELGARSGQLAGQLIAGGARPNRLVAVVMEKCWQQVVAVLGIVRSGAAYLPIDASLPRERIALLLENGEVDQIVTTTGYLPCIPDQSSNVYLIEDEHVDGGAATSLPLDTAAPSDLAYVIFTSGSTGIPKGVMIEHAAALNTIRDINSRYRVSESDSVFGLSNLSFDLSVYDIFGVLGAGGTLVLPRPDEYRDPQAWLTYLTSPDSSQITLWNTVPALMQMLVDYVTGRELTLSLRTVLLSGDWIPLDLPERIRALAPQAQLISLGGATEASIWSIEYPIEHVAEHWRSIPYGKALANQTFYVLQPDLSLAPLWVAGDLYIGGIGLARGYWRDEAKTNRSFILHPRTGERLYRTGDRGRLWPDGNIEFLGRVDQQVKVQGFRIELGEIEARLKSHALIADAVAVAHRVGRSHQLLAYVVGQPSEEIDTAVEQETEARLTSIAEKLEFKLAHKGVRALGARAAIDLGGSDSEVLVLHAPHPESSDYDEGPITLDALSELLRAYRRRSYPERQFPKAFYPSGGTLYAVQVYVEIAADRVRLPSGEYLPAGHYYYQPLTHQLVPLRRALSRSAPAVFRVLLVADYAAIKPLYGSLSEMLCRLEAGYMSSLLECQHASGLSVRAEDPALFGASTIPEMAESHCVMAVYAGGRSRRAATPATTPVVHDSGCVPVAEGCRFDLRAPPAAFELNLRARKSYRTYSSEAPSLEAMGLMLSALHPYTVARELTTYLRLRVPLHSKDGQVLDPGVYIYEATKNTLSRVMAAALPHATELFSGESGQIERGSSFAVFLVANRQRPNQKYQAAGVLGQLLSNGAPFAHIGLCAVGIVDARPIAKALQLAEDQHVYHALLGGAISDAQLLAIAETAAPRVDLERDILDFLRAGLPYYMVPQRIIPLARIPLSANGKVDRKALPIPELDDSVASQYQAPQGELELMLAALWQELLQVERVGRHDNFFELGGHSLSAVHFLMHVRDRLALTLPVRVVFESPTIAAIAERIQLLVELGRIGGAESSSEAASEQVEEGWV